MVIFLGISWDPITGARPSVHWQGRYQNSLLIFPYASRSLHLLDGKDILSHFYGPPAAWPMLTGQNSLFETNSAALFVGLRDPSALMSSLLSDSPTLSLVGNYFGGKHLSDPTIEDALAKGKQIVEDLRTRDASHVYQFYRALVHFQSVGVAKWWY